MISERDNLARGQSAPEAWPGSRVSSGEAIDLTAATVRGGGCGRGIRIGDRDATDATKQGEPN